MFSFLESLKQFFTYTSSTPVVPVKEKDKMTEITKTYLEGLSNTKVTVSGPGDNVKLFTIPSHIVLKDIDETLCVENTQTKQCLDCYLSSFTVCDDACSNKAILESISKGEFENVVVEPVVEPVVEVAEAVVEPVVEVAEAVVEPVVEVAEAVVEPVVEVAEAVVEPVVEVAEAVVEPVVEVAEAVVEVAEAVVEPLVELAEAEGIIENLVDEILFDIPKVELPFENYVPFPPYDSECPTPDCSDDLTVNKDYAFIDSESPGPETNEFD